ncbi:MAG: hypothetical protein A3G81_01535 [Betaproteobacteria bacterium RIFCSPLOWO2_12_FULL_65_14]|nr:MAG: hypothetical protein A3G81_01535 [Betaproteobacteria bacterium RIFCSPLOWO2_12_FULL_65_14]
MARVVRITAECAGEENWKIVLDAVLEGNKIKRQMCFGFVSSQEDGSTTRWPIMLRPQAPNGSTWVIDYGTNHEDSPQRTNLVDKDITLGNYFTVYDGTDEVTVRISQVTEL